MRQIVSGLVAAVAVVMVSAAPALACGGGLFGSCSPCGQTYSPCAAPVYVAPEPVVSTCGCGGAYERLPDPVDEYGTAPAVHQYYYANQGPTYTGPGDLAPYPTYREGGWGYRHHRHYGYAHTATEYDGAGVYGYRTHHFRPWHHGYRYGYATRHGYAPHFYGERHSLRYGGPIGMPRAYGHREMHEHMMRRYN
jgi:hypothetical protein